MRIYLKILALLYLTGAGLHILDIFDLRLHFSEMNATWKIWIIYLAIANTVTFLGLWNEKVYGIVFFFIVAISQLIAYGFFKDTFGPQNFLIAFHLTSIFIFGAFCLIKVFSKKI